MRGRAVLQTLIAGGIVVALVLRIGAAEIWSTLVQLRGWYLPIAILLLLSDSVIRAMNWRRLLRTRAPDLRLGPVLHSYLLGGVVGGFIPSSLGSDVARTGLIARRLPLRLTDLASSIFVLNAIGLWTLCAIALGQSLRFLLAGAALPLLPWTITVAGLGLLALTAAFVVAPFTHQIPVRGSRPLLAVLGALRSLGSFASERRALAGVALMAGLTFIAQFTVVFLLARALHLDVPFDWVALLLPIVLLSRLIPLSVAGFGAEQGVFVFAFSAMGVGAAEAFALSLATSSARLLFWALCAVAYFLASGAAAFGPLIVRGTRRQAQETKP